MTVAVTRMYNHEPLRPVATMITVITANNTVPTTDAVKPDASRGTTGACCSKARWSRGGVIGTWLM